MRRHFLLFIAACTLISCSISSTKDNDPWGKVDPSTAPKRSEVLRTLSMQSSRMGRKMTYSVWLPAEYDETRTYPFFYLLHGYETDDQNATFDTCWLDKGNMAKIADDYLRAGGVPMVIIMPNGLNKFYYADGYEAYFEEELMAKVEADYHCNGKRAIGGLSMGGFGTIFHALKYPEKFTYAYPMSPAAKMWSLDPKDFIGKQTDMSVFPPFTFEVGSNDGTVGYNVDSKNLYNYMKSKGIPCEWDEWTTGNLWGDHIWEFWQVCLPKALAKVGDSFK